MAASFLSTNTIERSPLTEAFYFALPALHEHTFSSVKKTIDTLLVKVKNYGVSTVIVDASFADVSMRENTLNLVINYLAIGLKMAHVKRLTIVGFKDEGTNAHMQHILSQVERLLYPSLEIKHFKNLDNVQMLPNFKV